MTDGHRHNPHTPPRRHTRIGRIPDSLIDAVIDGEIDERARREILAAARRNPQQRRELQETTDILVALRAPIPTPDFSGAVVAEVHRRRNYIPARVQRIVTRSRLAVAASLLLVLLSYVGASRTWPDAAVFNTSPTPVAQVERSVTIDAQRAASTYSRAQLPLPTVGALLEISITTQPSEPVAMGSVAFASDRTGFYTFPMPPATAPIPRHNNVYSPMIHYVGSSASTQPHPLDFNRESNLP